MPRGQTAKALPISQGLCVGSIFFIFLGSALGRHEPELFMKQVLPFFSTGRQRMVTESLSQSDFADGRCSSAKVPFLLTGI